jgi:hypothetical protein
MTRINHRRPQEPGDLEPYFTPPCAVEALLRIEGDEIPAFVVDPCCGSGNILGVLERSGRLVEGSDVRDYGWQGTELRDFLTDQRHCPPIVSNPPYKHAEAFLRTAIAGGCQYHAWLLRTNFLESVERKPLFEAHPPARVWISSRRLPMMHREGYDGPKTGSNQSFAWFIWEKTSTDQAKLNWFDWRG